MAKEEEMDGAAVYGGCLTIVVSIPVMMVFRGFVLVQLFGWFGEPVFHVHMRLIDAMGLALLASVLSGYSKTSPTEKESMEFRKNPIAKSVWGILLSVAWLGIAWGIGAFVHWVGG